MEIRLRHWLSQFCGWHEQYRKGELSAELLQAYRDARSDLSETLVLAQRLEIRAGGARQALRVARAIPVELELHSGRIMALTQDISVSGLSALVGEAAPIGSELSFRMKLGRDVAVIAGRCRVVAAIPLQGSVRMAVAFEEISDDAKLRIENLVFDAISAEIRTVLLRAGQRPTTAGDSCVERL